MITLVQLNLINVIDNSHAGAALLAAVPMATAVRVMPELIHIFRDDLAICG